MIERFLIISWMTPQKIQTALIADLIQGLNILRRRVDSICYILPQSITLPATGFQAMCRLTTET